MDPSSPQLTGAGGRDRAVAMVSPPSDIASTSALFSPTPRVCSFLGCGESRVSSRGYCGVHHSLFVAGKSANEAAINDIENSLFRLKDTIRKSNPTLVFSESASPGMATNGAAESRNSISLASGNINSIHQIINKTIEFLRKPDSAMPIASDIFYFSGLPYQDNISSPVNMGTAVNTNDSNSGMIYNEVKAADDPLSPNPLLDHPPSSAASASMIASIAAASPGSAPPIVEFQILQNKNRKTLPIGFSLIEKSMSGRDAADLNRSGNGQRVFLAHRRDGTKTGRVDKKGRTILDESSAHSLKPLTSISVIFKDACEEPHYNFDLIDRTADKLDDGSLSGGAQSGNPRQPFLTCHRGDGAPITHIGLLLKEKKENLPPGWHEVKLTPFGNRADLNSSNSVQVDSLAVYLCFRVDIGPVMRKFQLALRFIQSAALESQPLTADELKIHGFYARLLALIASLFYSNDQKLILNALECFRSLPSEGIHPILLNTFIQSLCDATPLFIVYFTTQTHASLLKFLFSFIRFYFPALSINSIMKIGEVCFLIRHEDKQFEISESILKVICGEIERILPCSECAAKPNHNESEPKNGNGDNNSSDSSLKFSGSNSPVLCHRCQKAKFECAFTPADWARSFIIEIAQNVSVAKQLENDGKSFQRHKRTSEEFRLDSTKIVNKLFQLDAEFQSQFGRQRHRSSFSVDSSASPTRFAQQQMNSAGLILHSHSQSNPHANGGTGRVSTVDDSDDEPERLENTRDSTVFASSPPSNSVLAPLDASVYLLQHKFDESRLCDSDRISFNLKHERVLFAYTLLCCKFATESVAFNVKKSETVKRKSHGLRLLLFILQNSGGFFRSSPASVHLLRRFVCPALMDACITDSLAIFRLLLQIFTVLWENFKSDLLIELGAFLDHIFLTFLESPFTSNEQKKDILEVLMHILRSPSALIDLFYNYDNHSKSWDIFERLQCVLSKISEGDLTKAAVSSQQKIENFNSVINNEPSTEFESEVASAEILQKAALKLLVHFLNLMCQWLGTPGCKRSPGVPSKPLLHEKSDSVDQSGQAPSVETMSVDELADLKTREKSGTWSARYDHQKNQQKISQHAVKLARTEKLSAALQYLKIVNPSNALPREIARFLYDTDGLDKSEVGDFLSNGEDKFLSAEEYDALRFEYSKLLDFTGMSFDASMRLYLCDSGFRLPGESQKIDRLLESFCHAYCRDNPQVFRNHGAALVMAFAVVMLNTDVHDPRLKNGNSSRKPMTLEQFFSNLRGLNDGIDFTRQFLEAAYNNICANAIEWKDEREKSAEQRSADVEAAKLDDQRHAAKKSFEIAVRKALAFLKNHAAQEQTFQHTKNTLIVQGMFEMSWYRAIAAISTRSDNAGSDIDMLHLCLEGLAYGSTIAVVLGLPTERQAFTRQLAKITFLERNRESKSMDIGRRIVQGDHLKQDWYKPLNLQAEKNPVRACLILFGIVTEFKAKINFERRQATLKRIESDFGGEICLVDHSRSLIKEGKLIKIGEKNQKRVSYHFMLFNDLILYASEGMNAKYKCHRVIHLSLCRLEDLKTFILPNSFRIVSPQKSFIVSAQSKEKKQQWVESILVNLKTILVKRKKFLSSNSLQIPTSPPSSENRASASLNDGSLLSPSISQQNTKESNSSSSVSGSISSASSVPVLNSPMNLAQSSDGDSMLRRYSTFIGQSEFDLTSPSQSATAAGPALRSLSHCKLCIRPFAIFRRRQKCRFCSDIVCSDCCARKVTIPGGEKRLQLVCDACYGAIKGMLGEDIPLLSTVDSGNSISSNGN